jgi:hypothetical protein
MYQSLTFNSASILSSGVRPGMKSQLWDPGNAPSLQEPTNVNHLLLFTHVSDLYECIPLRRGGA